MSRETNRALEDERQSRVDEEIRKFLEATDSAPTKHAFRHNTYTPKDGHRPHDDWAARLIR
jgi:hypothetical protein